MYGGFGWARRRAFHGQKRRFPGRAVPNTLDTTVAGLRTAADVERLPMVMEQLLAGWTRAFCHSPDPFPVWVRSQCIVIGRGDGSGE